ncbi:MAG: hypothetical protein PHQ39_06370 [Methanothrix soehngenii]|jgi:hypothetical protein|nr:hypothetical protein [Methanothrix soehngenii]
MVEAKKINLSAKKTEAEWIEANDSFFLKATPVWFEWLEWIIIIGAIQVIADKTQDRYVQFIRIISHFFLMFYFLAFFYHIEFHGIPWIKSEKIRGLVSIILSMLLGVGVYYLLLHLVTQLTT